MKSCSIEVSSHHNQAATSLPPSNITTTSSLNFSNNNNTSTNKNQDQHASLLNTPSQLSLHCGEGKGTDSSLDEGSGGTKHMNQMREQVSSLLHNKRRRAFTTLQPASTSSSLSPPQPSTNLQVKSPIISSNLTSTPTTFAGDAQLFNDLPSISLVVDGVVYVKLDSISSQVEEIMNKYSKAKREHKERESAMKTHFEKMDKEKTEQLEYWLKEFEERSVSIQNKCRDHFSTKYKEKVEELNKKITELMDEKEVLKNRLERDGKKMENDMQILVSDVETKMKLRIGEFRSQQEELSKTIRIQKKLFFGLLNYTRRELKHVDTQTEELVAQDLEMEQFRKQIEELKFILDTDQFEFQKVFVEKEARLLHEITESKIQLSQLESCVKEQTISRIELESQTILNKEQLGFSTTTLEV